MKMKRQKVLALSEALAKAGQVKGNGAWQFTIARNLRVLKDETDAFRLTADAVEQQRANRALELAEKDSAGNPVLLDGQDQYGHPMKRYKLAPEAAKELFELVAARNRELQGLLDEDVEIALCAKLRPSDVPDSLAPTDLEAILDMVEPSEAAAK